MSHADRPSVPMPDLQGHIPALDGVRGLAILLVMFFHFTLPMNPTALVDRAVWNVSLFGSTGVDLFFVLSGFLITGILYDAKGGERFFRNFYMRRALRIFPLYYGFLLVAFVLAPRVVTPTPAYSAFLEVQGWFWTYLANLLIAVKPDLLRSSANMQHFWSLAVEEQFYLLWPTVVFFFSRQRLMTICAWCIGIALALRVGLALAGAIPQSIYVLTPNRMDTLLLGAWLALEARGPHGLARVARWMKPVALGTVAILLAVFARTGGIDGEDPIYQTIGYSAVAFLYGALLVLALTRPQGTRLHGFFAHPALSFFGRYSYGLYVFHFPVLYVLTLRGIEVRNLPQLFGSQLPAQLVFLVVASLCALAVSLVSWHAFEKQFLKLKRLFPYDRQEPAPARRAVMASAAAPGLAES